MTCRDKSVLNEGSEKLFSTIAPGEIIESLRNLLKIEISRSKPFIHLKIDIHFIFFI